MMETAREWGGPGRLTLGHLIALNDEIAALARAGLPLERGLRDVGRDVSGRLSTAMARLSERMEGGASLPEALAAEGDQFPPIYRAVIEAGIRSGRLPAALESLASFIRSYAEARRAIGLALAYPLLVLVLAYALVLGLLTQLVPRFRGTFVSLHLPVPAVVSALYRIGETAVYWGPVLPALVVLLVLLWAWSGRAASLRPGPWGSPLRWFPWMRSMLAQFEAANFAQLLATLIEQGVPYPEAIVLAADSSGDRALARAGHALADAARRGEALAQPRSRSGVLPPLLRWLLTTGRPQPSLAVSLRHVAATYRKRALHQAEKIRVYLPTVLLLSIGMTATLLYALTLFVPFASLLGELASP